MLLGFCLVQVDGAYWHQDKFNKLIKLKEMKLISVPILYHTKESETLENCGILVNEDNL